jgi:hypothetical protein
MATTKKDYIITAVEAVHSALKDLQADERLKVLASVRALLEITGGEGGVVGVITPTMPAPAQFAPSSQTTRPLSIVELMQDKNPKTIPQMISLFAYYREKSEGTTRFGRDDLKPYFAKAKLKPPGNYDRDFIEVVKKGWIHEDGSDSYLTSRGVEVVESGFTGERASSRPVRSSMGSRKKIKHRITEKAARSKK